MRKSILMGVMTTLAMSTLATSMFVVAATTGPLNILSAYADKDTKFKSWSGEGGGATTICSKGDDLCKGINVNKGARENCEDNNGGSKCKQVNLNK